MSVRFFIPDQHDAWGRINRDLMARSAGYSLQTLEDMWEAGLLSIHEMATAAGPFGFLVVARFDLGLGGMLHVMWCEVRPRRALREEKEWLWEAARYLERVAKQYECREVRIAVAEDHPSPSWLRRLRGVGFGPRTVELGIAVAA